MSDPNINASSLEAQPVLVECPACLQPGFVDVKTIIISSVDTEETQALLEGRLFDYTCPACEQQTTMAYDCLFQDVEHRTLLLYATGRDALETGTRRLDAMLKRERVSEDDPIASYQGRLVTNPFEFCEKARILADGLDDRVIELLKVAIGRGMVAEGLKGAHDALIYECKKEDGGISFVVVGEIPGDVVGVPQGYTFCEKLVAEAGDELRDRYCFDHFWAELFLP